MKFKTEEIENLIHEPVESFQVSKGCNDEDSVSSSVLQITVKTKSGKTNHLIYKKLPLHNPAVLEYAIRGQIFYRENYFYNTYAPNVESLIKIKSYLNPNDGILTKLQLQLPIPKYFAGFNNDVDDFICLEDLRPQGFTMPDKTIGLNLLECSLVLKKLGQFHALSYFYLRYEGESVFHTIDNYKVYLRKHWSVPPELPVEDGDQNVNKETLEAVFKNSIELIKNHCGDIDNRDKLVSKMMGLSSTVYEEITRTTLNTDSKYFPLLIHGDFWLNNVLLSYNAENGEPTDAKIIDFQFSRRGNIYEDLNYFMYTSTTADYRKKYLGTSLNAYYDSFISTLRKMNFPPPLHFTRGQFMNDFYDNILQAYVFLSFALPFQLGKDGEDGDASDLDFVDYLNMKMLHSPLALRRWEEATREAVEMGII